MQEHNDTLQNLIEAINNVKLEVKNDTILLVYNEEGVPLEILRGHNVTTDKQHIQITVEEFEKFTMALSRVVDGKFVPAVKREFKYQLPLVPGNTWYTTEHNMLIIGDEIGWDKRSY